MNTSRRYGRRINDARVSSYSSAGKTQSRTRVSVKTFRVRGTDVEDRGYVWIDVDAQDAVGSRLVFLVFHGRTSCSPFVPR